MTTTNTEPGQEVAVVEQTTDILRNLGQVESEWGELDFLDQAGEGERSIPVIKINRKADGSGGIKIAGDDDDRDRLLFVWAARGMSRVSFDGPYDAANPPKVNCRSVDGRKPDDFQPLWQTAEATDDEPAAYEAPSACTVCPHSWERGGKCKKNMEALVYLQDPSDDSGAVRVARLRFGGLAFKEARLYWESFGFRIPKIPPVAYITEMALEKTATPNGIFLVPWFERKGMLTREQATVFIEDARARMGQWKAELAEDIVEVAEDVVVASGGPFDEPSRTIDPETGEVTVDGDGMPF